MSEPLKPCPFCGSTIAEEIDALEKGWFVMCEQCEAKGPRAETQDGSRAVWNTQALEATVATLTAKVARLKTLLGEFVEGDMASHYLEIHDSFVCGSCDQEGYDHAGSNTIDHKLDCLVLRARAALAPEETL